MPQTSYRTSTFTESVIRRMTRVANQHGAINLSQGFPDFDPPEALLKAAERTAREGPHQYAVTWGAQDFRTALAKKQSRFMGLPLYPDENFVVTCGSTEAMMVAMMTACNPGDKVIVFSPFYENYAADAILSGHSRFTFRCTHPGSASIRANCAVPLSSVRKRWCCAIPQILPARCSPAKSCCTLPRWRKSSIRLC